MKEQLINQAADLNRDKELYSVCGNHGEHIQCRTVYHVKPGVQTIVCDLHTWTRLIITCIIHVAQALHHTMPCHVSSLILKYCYLF